MSDVSMFPKTLAVLARLAEDRRAKAQLEDIPDLAIGSAVWPGAAKVLEEGSELCQVLAKLAAYPTAKRHPDGSHLPTRLTDEIGDVYAALDFFVERNEHLLSCQRITDRRRLKLRRFREWHHRQ